MSNFFPYFDDIARGTFIAASSALAYAGDFRGKEDDVKVFVRLLDGRGGQTTAGDLRRALGDGAKTVVLADPGYTIHYINKEDAHSTRRVIAWTISLNIWGSGYKSEPVPDRAGESPFGFGSEFVAVERPDGTLYTAYKDFPDIESWSRHASKELVSWHKRPSA